MKKRPWQLLLAGATSLVVLGPLIGFAFLATYYYLKPTLPDVAAIRQLKLQVPLRVYSRDGLLIGQIGEQRRSTRRPRLSQLLVFGGILLAFASGAAARQASPILERHEGDDYTRYELLAPESAQFRITYEVTAARAGARYYFNIIRKGSEASDEAVFDRMTGQPLPWKVVTGAEARAAGQANVDLDANYIQVALARPVPAGGETRLRIDKTYRDAKSYYREGDVLVFARGLGIRRNSVVLPAG